MTSSRSQFQFSQADIAKRMCVDRTTIRAWTESGMPYKAPAMKGCEGVYDIGICSNWVIYAGMRKREYWPKVEPLFALALGYASGVRDQPIARKEGAKFFSELVASHFAKMPAEAAYHWALGFLDCKEA